MRDDADKAVLRDLARVAAREGLRFFVIGAGARLLVHDWPHGLAGGRATTDWDIAVRVATWADFERLRSALTGDEASFKLTDAEHRLVHARGRRLDIVPFGGVEVDDRTIAYPQGQTAHSVVGLQECEDCCIAVDVGEGVSVNAVVPKGLVLLKAKAYLDRRPAVTHDVQDIDYIVRTYADTLSEVTVLERASDSLQEERVAYEHVGAYLLGGDVAELGVDKAVLAPLRALLAELADPLSRAVDDVHASGRWGPEQDRTRIVRRYMAFTLGLGT